MTNFKMILKMAMAIPVIAASVWFASEMIGKWMETQIEQVSEIHEKEREKKRAKAAIKTAAISPRVSKRLSGMKRRGDTSKWKYSKTRGSLDKMFFDDSM